jgi:NhaP-type Na+/H+ or K+/H+ antiporter
LYFGQDFDALVIAEDVVVKFGVGILLGLAVGVVWLWVLHKIKNEPYTYISTLAVLILMVMGSEILGGKRSTVCARDGFGHRQL